MNKNKIRLFHAKEDLKNYYKYDYNNFRFHVILGHWNLDKNDFVPAWKIWYWYYIRNTNSFYYLGIFKFIPYFIIKLIRLYKDIIFWNRERIKKKIKEKKRKK